MGRRGFVNIENKIQEEVLRENFKYGISAISTKDVAKKLHISEPVIFAHFHTKKNLIDSCFRYSWNKLPKDVVFPMSEEDMEDPKVIEKYLEKFRSILAEPKALVYVNNYFHSPFFDAELSADVKKDLVDMISKRIVAYESHDAETIKMIIRSYIKSFISRLAEFASGAVEPTDLNMRLALGQLLFGAYGMVKFGAKILVPAK
ncbi:MAG: TetR/AcrR family transcriptional regulator [Bacilli bacterium]|jgi:AcrR family transcriptional regulator|nr:TetR/AcrR family transcriptional regulator [Bacilli bacterium]